MRRIPLALTLALAALAAAAACAPEGPTEEEALISIVDAVIVPAYESAAAETSELRGALAAHCAAPSGATLADARQAWRDASVAWARTEAGGVGPVQDRRSDGYVAWPVVEPERIEALIADNPALTADAARNEISSTQRGLGGVEHALFADDADATLTSGSPRCAYLLAVSEVAAEEASAVVDEWVVARRGTGPPYKDYFTGRSSSSLITNEAVAEVVRTPVFLIREIVDMRLAGALGLRGDPDPTAIPGAGAEHALPYLRAQIEGMRDVYEGADGGWGISSLVSPLSGDADGRMRDRFRDALAAMDAVDGPLRPAAAAGAEEVVALHDALMALQNTLSTEVVSLLGVSVGFSDADGDSSR